MSQPVSITTTLASFPDCLASLTGLALQRARRADVILGMPGHDCRFHGICKVEEYGVPPVVSPYVCNNGKVAGWLLRPRSSHCILLIEKGTLSASLEQYHFARREIEVSQPVDVTPFYNKGGDRRYFLRKGEYPLRITKDFYMLYLPLTNHAQESNDINPHYYE